jgi:hypothetical protein
MVSPANKKGALIELTEQGGQVQAASDGSGVTYITQGSHVGDNPVGHVTYTQTLSSRTAGGWKSLDLTLPGRLPENGEPALSVGQFQFEYRGFSPDLGSGVVEPQIAGTPPLSPNVSERTLYLWNSAIGSFLPIVTPENVFPIGRNIEEPQASTDFALHFLAMSPNAQHIVFRTPLALTEEAIQEETLASHVPVQIQWNLYEWSGGKLQLVNVLPNGKVAHGPYPAVPPVRLAGMTNVNGLGRGGGQHDVSSNGRWVAWTWGEPYTSEQLASYRGLYVRDTTEEVTTRVGGTDAVFQTMTEDGSGVFYLEKGDLYEFDTETGLTTDLTGNHAPGESGEVQEAVSDISRDGAYAYFVANRDLASGGVDGQNNLYVSHRTGTEWATSYIATLSAQDKPTWYAETFNVPFLARISARTSPNGRYLAFMSNMPLTGYDNTDAVSGMADEEVFEYDAVKGLLACASCDPTGARPAGVLDTPGSELLVDRGGVWTSKETTEKDLHVDHWLAGSVPGWDNLNNNPATYQPRYLSDNGRLFFDSPVGLVAQDTNGLEDVYEFEPEGVGDCVSGEPPFSTMLPGCVSLMSSGTASAESAFYDASEGGDDVFFTTTGKLSGEDYDRGYDVYDAHVCTSAAPCDDVTKGTVGPCSSGDACKGAPTPQPDIFGPVSSATFSGGGNVIPGSVQTRVASRAQKLARAVRLCRRKKTVRRRTLCIRAARKRYGVTPAQRTVTGRRERRSN